MSVESNSTAATTAVPPPSSNSFVLPPRNSHSMSHHDMKSTLVIHDFRFPPPSLPSKFIDFPSPATPSTSLSNQNQNNNIGNNNYHSPSNNSNNSSFTTKKTIPRMSSYHHFSPSNRNNTNNSNFSSSTTNTPSSTTSTPSSTSSPLSPPNLSPSSYSQASPSTSGNLPDLMSPRKKISPKKSNGNGTMPTTHRKLQFSLGLHLDPTILNNNGNGSDNPASSSYSLPSLQRNIDQTVKLTPQHQQQQQLSSISQCETSSDDRQMNWEEMASLDFNTVTLHVIHPNQRTSERNISVEGVLINSGSSSKSSSNSSRSNLWDYDSDSSNNSSNGSNGSRRLLCNTTFSNVYQALETANNIPIHINVNIKIARGQYQESSALSSISRPNLWIEGERGVIIFGEQLKIVSPFISVSNLHLQFNELTIEQGRISFINVRFGSGYHMITKFSSHEIAFDSCRFSKGKLTLGTLPVYKATKHIFRNCKLLQCEVNVSHCITHLDSCSIHDSELSVIAAAELNIYSTLFTNCKIDVRKLRKNMIPASMQQQHAVFKKCTFDSGSMSTRRGAHNNLFSKCDFMNSSQDNVRDNVVKSRAGVDMIDDDDMDSI